VERISVAAGPRALHARLNQLGAQFQRDRSKPAVHIYWAPASGRWIKVVSSGGVATLTYHATCPCNGG
jgi:hypothetical protein